MRCMAVLAFALICLLSLQMWMVLPPLHWPPQPAHMPPGLPNLTPIFDGADSVPLRRRVDELETVLLSMQASVNRDLHEHEARLQRVEGGKQQGHGGFLDGGILGRLAALEESAKAQHGPAPAPCPAGIGKLSSREDMSAGGWKLSVDSVKYHGGSFIGWGDGDRAGTISLIVNASGKLLLHVKNAHHAKASENVVYLAVNGILVFKLERYEERSICLRLDAGDVVKLSEIYGQIQVSSASMSCAADPAGSAVAKPSIEGTQCEARQKVRVPGRVCGTSWMQGEIDRLLNESHAIVRLSEEQEELPGKLRNKADTSSATKYRLYTASDLQLASSGSQKRAVSCMSFKFERFSAGIIVVADIAYREKYANQIATQRCFAAWRGYSYAVIDATEYPSCERYREFFFQKHCVVAEYLAEQPPEFVAAVMDADVVAVVLNRGLEEWFRIGADIHFYERVWCFEIAAGNYIVRNTPWARNFLMRWADFMYLQPDGFSSFDNGAIHLHLIQTLELEGAAECRDQYTRIRGYNNSELDQYFTFVNCTKNALGPPRLWRTSDGGTIAFWGKLHFFVADGVYLARLSSDFFGPVFQHGIKEADMVVNEFYSDVGRCELNSDKLHRTREGYSETILQQAKWLSGHLSHWPYNVKFPRASSCNSTDPYEPCILPCVSTLSCQLLRNNEEPKPRRSCTECQNLI